MKRYEISKEECPVCKNNKYFSCDISSPDGYTAPTNNYIGKIDLNVCTKCGCVYVCKRDLDSYNSKKGNK